MTIIFKAKTKEGYVMKILAELLQNNIKTACFEIDQTGISLRTTDHHLTILIDLEMKRDNFHFFKYKGDKKMYIGINLSHFHKMLKTIKKRDSIELFIDDESPTDFGIKVIPKENNRVTASFVKIQCTQNIDMEMPTGYDNPIIIPSGEFQKMCKGMTSISNTINVSSKNFMIKFSCDNDGVMKRYTEFGEPDDPADSESDDDDDNEPDYNEEFDTEQLSRITKMAGLNNSLQVYPKEALPLLFRTSIGTLGKISIYIKSKKQRACETKADSDEE